MCVAVACKCTVRLIVCGACRDVAMVLDAGALERTRFEMDMLRETSSARVAELRAELERVREEAAAAQRLATTAADSVAESEKRAGELRALRDARKRDLSDLLATSQRRALARDARMLTVEIVYCVV